MLTCTQYYRPEEVATKFEYTKDDTIYPRNDDVHLALTVIDCKVTPLILVIIQIAISTMWRPCFPFRFLSLIKNFCSNLTVNQ